MPPKDESTGTTVVERPRTPALRILSELSRGTYVSYSRAAKELVSNAWDALASNVQFKISEDFSEITILDDGVGMSEDDIRERFLRIGGSTATQASVRQGRRLIGHKGIGALSVINICKEVRVLTTQQGSAERLEAILDIPKVLELAKQDEDLESHYVYQLTKWGNEEKSSHYTFITLRDLTPEMREFLSKKGVSADQYISNVGELSGVEQFKWELALVSPVPYSGDSPFKGFSGTPIGTIKNELLKANFSVSVNGQKLLKPLQLPSADVRYSAQKKYKRGLDYEIYPVEHSDSTLEFRGYIFSQATAIMPADIRGGLIRVNNVAIGKYDLNWMQYQQSMGPRLVLTSGEIYVYRGLEQALLIDRDRFRETDKNYKAFREIVHNVLRDAFGGATSRSRKRSNIEKERKAESFREKMDAKVSTYLRSMHRRKPLSLHVEKQSNKPPIYIDSKTGKVVVNEGHKIFRKLKANEKELVEAFLIAIGIGRERAAGDANRMTDEIFKIVEDLFEARRAN
ncbi:MAG: hypothetical protein JWO13_458 [Acidobacteriales bacterium]|nr:hypothetical protein [Terriglobales bacterium]